MRPDSDSNVSSPPVWKVRSPSPLITPTEIGTRCRFSRRRSAVTTISPRPSLASGGVAAVGASAAAAGELCAKAGAAARPSAVVASSHAARAA